MRKVMEISDTKGMKYMRKKVSKGFISSLIKRKWNVLQYCMKGAFHFCISGYRLFETTRTL